MSSLKYYIGDFNGVLTPLKERLIGHIASPREANVWIVFQDVLGSYGDLIKTVKKYWNKKIYVVQHGRAATLDYDEPNSFPLTADKFLCWGQSDYDRMCKLGYKDRTVIVGCPLNLQVKPPIIHEEKIVLFVPVNTGKEEPENIATYYELLKLKYDKAQVKVLQNRDILKDKWGFNNKPNVQFNEIARDFDVVAKLLPWHDKSLYHGNTIVGYQHLASNNDLVFNLLRNVDLVVGIDEGCTEIYAYAHNVPVIVVDGFKYRQHKPGGKNYAEEDIYRTSAATHVRLNELKDAVQYELAYPQHLKQQRKIVAEAELGISYGNAIDNILKVIKNDIKNQDISTIR